MQCSLDEKNEIHFGYKNHTAVGHAHKLIREFEVTSAEVYEVFLDGLS